MNTAMETENTLQVQRNHANLKSALKEKSTSQLKSHAKY